MKKIILIMTMIFAFAFASEAQIVKETNQNTFTKKILPKSKKPIVIDFYATWCGPCKAMKPHLEKAARTYKGRIDFYCVDVDKNQEWANYLGIASIPTLVIYKNGKIYTVETGYREYDELVTLFNYLLKK